MPFYFSSDIDLNVLYIIQWNDYPTCKKNVLLKGPSTQYTEIYIFPKTIFIKWYCLLSSSRFMKRTPRIVLNMHVSTFTITFWCINLSTWLPTVPIRYVEAGRFSAIPLMCAYVHHIKFERYISAGLADLCATVMSVSSCIAWQVW